MPASRLAVLPLLALVAGCAGSNFVRPTADAFQLGKTRREQVVQQLGEPRGEGSVLKDGTEVKTIGYAYAAVGGEPLEEGVIPARGLTFYFASEVLVGEEFLSSFKEDHSSFDDQKVPLLVKGKTSRAEVIQLLGRPSGRFLAPMVKATSGEALGWSYQATRGNAFSGFKSFKKALVVTFDAQDRVAEVELVSGGNR